MISGIKTQISQFQLFPTNKSNCQTVQSTYRYNNSNRTKNKCECQCRCRQINPFQEQHQQIEASRERGREKQDGEQFRCMECELQVERVAQLKKKNVVVQYRSARLEEEIEQLRRENENLKGKIRELIEERIKWESNGSHTQSYSYKTVKQDLQAQLFQCKILNQLLMHTQSIPSSSSPSSSQLQSKLESSLLQTLTLHCQLEQKTRIISDTVLYPIYHYDRRLKHLKEVIGYLCGKLREECRRLADCNRGLRVEIGELRARVRGEIRGLEGKLVGEFERMEGQGVGDGVKMWKLEDTQSRNKQKTIPHLTPKNSQLLHSKQKPKQSTQKHPKKAQPQLQQKTRTKKSKTQQQKYLRPCCMNLNSNPNSNLKPII